MNTDTANIFRELDAGTLLGVALIVAGAFGLTVLVQRLLPWIADKLAGRYRLYILATVPILRLLVIVVALGLIIPLLVEPTFENLVAFLGAAGLALGFALKDYASSLLAGIVVLYEASYRPGDWVEIEGTYGEVKAIGMRALEMVTPDDTTVVVPHLKLWDHLIHNANDGTQYLLCVADFYLHPQHEADRVRHALHDVALTSPYLQLERPVTVIVLEKPWGTHYRLKAYPVDPRDQFLFITDLTVRGKAALADLGASFAVMPALPDGYA